MNFVDLGIVCVIAVSALLGMSRGFVREMLGLGAWALAVFGAIRFGPSLIPWASGVLQSEELGTAAGYGVTFLALILLLSLGANLVGRAVRLSALGGVDRSLGLVFGVGRGVLLLFALYILAGVVLPHSEAWPPVLKDSRAVPYLYQGAAWMVSFLPETYRPKLAEPVQPPPTISADLLHVSPEGRALGPRPERN